jgi:hypothetical protein
MQTKKHILIGTSIFNKYLRQDLCVESLHKLKNKNSNVDICLIQQPSDEVLYDNINIVKKLTRNSSDVFETTKKIPFINDIFNVMSDESKEVFVYCNSDIILTQKLIDHINSIDVEAFGISRIDIGNIETLTNPAKIIRMEPSGFDCWVISKSWWMQHKNLFLDFVIGRPYFDVMYTVLMLMNSSNLYISTEHLIYHVMHDRAWADKDECYHFNRLQKEKHYEQLELIWGECCNNTFLKRSDWGSFLNFRPDEQSIIQQIKTKKL